MKKREETIEKVYKEKEHYLDEVKTKEDAFRDGINAAMQVLNLHLVSKRTDTEWETYAKEKAASEIKAFCEYVMYPQSELHKDAQAWIDSRLK